VRRVRTYGTEFTTSAPITRVHYAIRTYDATGRLVQTVQGRRSFDFDYKGVAWLRQKTLNPRSRPGKVRITVTVGRAGVAGCLVAFRQPPLAARSGVPVILMHMRGEPRTMQKNIHYDEVVSDVGRELTKFRDDAVAAGIDRAQILVDPGIGFGKTFEHNLELLARAGELQSIAPLVIGASRKAFIGHITGRSAGPHRMVGSLAAIAAAHRAGATLVRVHDVRETVDFLKVLTAIAERER